MISRRNFLKFLGGSLLSAAALGAYAVGIEPLLTRVKRYVLTPPAWPPGLHLKIAVLSDIHACKPWMTVERIRALAAQANGLDADVIVLLGDYVAGTRWVSGWVDASEWAPALAGLTAPLGVFAVLGNHDWWEDRTAQKAGAGPTIARLALEKAGIPVLENEVVRLQKKGKSVWLAGLGDQLATLSGRTHGGQVRLFGYSPVVPSRFGNRYAYGHVVEDDRNLIVSGGLGFSIAPVRFGVRPEILLVELGQA